MTSPAQVVWDYLRMGDTLQQADIILVCCSNDLRWVQKTVKVCPAYNHYIRVADRAVALYKAGLAPLVLFSGGRGNFTEGWQEEEAVIFGRRAEERGLPGEVVMVEARSSNTGENILFSHRPVNKAYIKDPDSLQVAGGT